MKGANFKYIRHLFQGGLGGTGRLVDLGNLVGPSSQANPSQGEKLSVWG